MVQSEAYLLQFYVVARRWEQQELQNKSISFLNFNTLLLRRTGLAPAIKRVIPGELCHDLLNVAAISGTALIKQRLVLLHKPQS